MLQLLCPACERVVWVKEEYEDDPDTVPCPRCAEPLNGLARRKSRPALATLQTDAPSSIIVAPPIPARTTVLDPEPEQALPDVQAEEAADFDVPCPEPDVRYVPLPYRPEGGLDGARFPFFLLGVFVAGALLGWLASTVGQVCYLVFIYPFLMGLGVAGIVTLATHLGRVRVPLIAALAGGIAGAGAIATMHLMDWRHTLTLVARESAALPEELAQPMLHSHGFFEYLEAQAEHGLTISGQGAGGFSFGQAGTIAYWVVEAFLVLFLAMAGGACAARDPFCTRCRSWKEEQFLTTLRQIPAQLDTELARGNLAVLQQCTAARKGGDARVEIAYCRRCGTEAPVDFKLVHRNRHARPQTPTAAPVLHWTYPGEALREFLRLRERQEMQTPMA